MIRAEQMITLDPNRFAAWIASLCRRQEWQGKRAGQYQAMSQKSNPNLFEPETRPGAQVMISFSPRGADKPAGIFEARPSAPGAVLAVVTNPADWPTLKTCWQELRAELGHDGLLADKLDTMDAEEIERRLGILARIPDDQIYRVTVQQAMTGFGRGATFLDPAHYQITEGGAGETRWLNILRDDVCQGRFTFTPKAGGTECRLNWSADSEGARITMLGLLDFHVKEMEAEAAQPAPTIAASPIQPSNGGGPAKSKRGPHKYAKADKIAARQAWADLDKEITPTTLDAWLESRFGLAEGGILNVPPSTFYGWPKS